MTPLLATCVMLAAGSIATMATGIIITLIADWKYGKDALSTEVCAVRRSFHCDQSQTPAKLFAQVRPQVGAPKAAAERP